MEVDADAGLELGVEEEEAEEEGCEGETATRNAGAVPRSTPGMLGVCGPWKETMRLGSVVLLARCCRLLCAGSDRSTSKDGGRPGGGEFELELPDGLVVVVAVVVEGVGWRWGEEDEEEGREDVVGGDWRWSRSPSLFLAMRCSGNISWMLGNETFKISVPDDEDDDDDEEEEELVDGLGDNDDDDGVWSIATNKTKTQNRTGADGRSDKFARGERGREACPRLI